MADQLSKAEATLAEVDAQLHPLESRLDPSDISPIRAQSTHHSLSRGSLVKMILWIVKAAAPVTTSEIADEIQARFRIEFLIEKTRMNWRHDSVGKQLRKFLNAGLVDQVRGSRLTGEDVRWRLKSGAVLSSNHLRELAAARGAEVLEHDAYHE